MCGTWGTPSWGGTWLLWKSASDDLHAVTGDETRSASSVVMPPAPEVGDEGEEEEEGDAEGDDDDEDEFNPED